MILLYYTYIYVHLLKIVLVLGYMMACIFGSRVDGMMVVSSVGLQICLACFV